MKGTKNYNFLIFEEIFFTAVFERTLLTITAPSLAHRAATVLLSHSTLPWKGALATSIIIVTLFLPHIDASQRVRSLAQLISDWALANHSTLRIDAPSVLANASCLHALVYVYINVNHV